jgi:exopolysaccharide biosynthesis protein
VGTLIRQVSATVPADFARYSNVLGAGPLLVQNRQIVLNAKAEGFSDAFIRQTAVRSAIGTTAAGNLLIATIHNRAGGTGPTLEEMTKILYYLGCVDALNLDGGSSTSLYLGGQLLNRSPLTAARVHNGLGIFLQPRP